MFDAAVAVTPNRLAGIILEPLSPVAVEDHKAAIIKEFCTSSARHKALWKSGSAYWTATRPTHDLRLLMSELAQFRAPLVVKTLARRINREVPEAEFRLQWFYDDPILDVLYQGEVTHVAIWNHGQVLAIATAAPPRAGFYGWLSRLVAR